MQKILDKIQKGYEIDQAQLYQNTFADYRKMLLPAALTLFVILAIAMVTYMIFVMVYFGDPLKASEEMAQFNLLTLSTNQLFFYYGINSIVTAIFSIITAGFIALAKQVHDQQLPSLGTLFSFFIKKQGFAIFFFTFILQLLLSGLSLVLQMYGLSLVSFFLFILIHTLTLLVIPLLIFNKLPLHKAVSYSVQLINQQPFRILSLLLFFGLFAIGGVFLFLVGFVITFPILYAFIYNLYHQIIEKD